MFIIRENRHTLYFENEKIEYLIIAYNKNNKRHVFRFNDKSKRQQVYTKLENTKKYNFLEMRENYSLY